MVIPRPDAGAVNSPKLAANNSGFGPRAAFLREETFMRNATLLRAVAVTLPVLLIAPCCDGTGAGPGQRPGGPRHQAGPGVIARSHRQGDRCTKGSAHRPSGHGQQLGPPGRRHQVAAARRPVRAERRARPPRPQLLARQRDCRHRLTRRGRAAGREPGCGGGGARRAGGGPRRYPGHDWAQGAVAAQAPAGACPRKGRVQLNPQAIESIHAATQGGRGPAAQNLGYTGAGVKVAWIADGIDINNPDFIRANGQHVFVDYKDFSGTGTTHPPTAARLSSTPVPSPPRAGTRTTWPATASVCPGRA